MTRWYDDGDFHPRASYWLPTWWEIKARAAEKDANDNYTADALYYQKFGPEALDIWSSYTNLNNAKSDILKMFNDAYASRMINSETLEQWQVRLQAIAGRTAARYDRALSLYASNAADLTDTSESQTTTYNDLTNAGRASDSTNTSTTWTAGYADQRTENVQSGSVRVETNATGGPVNDINANIDRWRNILQEFTDEFAVCFLNIFE